MEILLPLLHRSHSLFQDALSVSLKYRKNTLRALGPACFGKWRFNDFLGKDFFSHAKSKPNPSMIVVF